MEKATLTISLARTMKDYITAKPGLAVSPWDCRKQFTRSGHQPTRQTQEVISGGFNGDSV
jgi:hypothetical protein